MPNPFEFQNDSFDKFLFDFRLREGRSPTKAERAKLVRQSIKTGGLDVPLSDLDRFESAKAATNAREERNRTGGRRPNTILASPDAFGSAALGMMGKRMRLG